MWYQVGFAYLKPCHCLKIKESRQEKCITAYTEKVQALQDSVAVYAVRTNNSATKLRDWVFVQDAEHLMQHAKFEAADWLGD